MPEVQTVDEVVNNRTVGGRGGGLAARPTESESVDNATGSVKVDRSGIEDDKHGEGGRRGRVLKESTAKLLEKLEAEKDAAENARKPAPHEEGDADEEEEAVDNGDAGEADEAGGDDADEGAGEEDSDEEAEKPDPAAEWQTKAATLEQRNRELINELDTARKTPKSQRTERETALVAAEAAYYDEGSVGAVRKFLSVITGAAPDSKEVDAELTGVYIDLAARELGVPLDQNQQQLRDNARTRLLLARDKREKAEADKKPVVDNSAEAAQIEQGTKYIDNLLVTKGQSGTSFADEYPMLMDLAEDFDGYKPAEVLARAVRREFMTGTLNPATTSETEALHTVARKIEAHYDAFAKRIEAARAKKIKPNTTNPSGKTPKAAVEASKEQRQSPAARTLTNAAASRAPATTPKVTKQKAKQAAEKTRRDFPSDAAWRQHLLDKHSLS